MKVTIMASNFRNKGSKWHCVKVANMPIREYDDPTPFKIVHSMTTL